MNRSYRYRIYPTRRQVEALEAQLGFACDLYNAALEQRREWWKRGRRVSQYEQGHQLVEVRHSDLAPEMSSGCQEQVLRRLDDAFEAFFRRVRAGQKPGYPRFRPADRYSSLTWRRGKKGAAIRDGRLRLQGIGHVKVLWHRPLPAEPLTTTVKRTGGKWHVVFVVAVDRPASLASTGQEIGIDLGITTFAACSNGERIDGPRAFKAARAELRRAQRRVDRRQRGSVRQRKAQQQVALCHERVKSIRVDHAHKTALALVRRFDTIYVEDLNIAGLARTFLSREVADQSWARFLTILHGKAEEAGREVVAVDPRGTSQRCSACGATVVKPLSVRVHECDCGYVADRDENAANNILGAGRALQALTGTVSVV